MQGYFATSDSEPSDVPSQKMYMREQPAARWYSIAGGNNLASFLTVYEIANLPDEMLHLDDGPDQDDPMDGWYSSKELAWKISLLPAHFCRLRRSLLRSVPTKGPSPAPAHSWLVARVFQKTTKRVPGFP